jgi:hypothetical protein
MNAAKCFSIACSVIAISVPLITSDKAWSDPGQPVLPGHRHTVEQCLVQKVDLIVVAKLLKLGPFDPPRRNDVLTYEGAEFEIIRVLRGKAKGIVTMQLLVDIDHPVGPGSVEENVSYIIFSYVSEYDGLRTVGKMLLDGEKTEKDVATAIAAVH